MRALPEVLKRRPNAQVPIIGGSRVSYGADPPAGRTGKDIFLQKTAADLDLERVHFTGPLRHGHFLKALQVSAAHVYLTYPFILSWSMLEAISAGCLVIGTDTGPVTEVIQHQVNGLLILFLQPEALAECIVRCLAGPKRFRHLRDAARRTVLDQYDFRTACRVCLTTFVRRRGSRSAVAGSVPSRHRKGPLRWS